jgi:hypothetical protein
MLLRYAFKAMDGENQLLVTNEPVGFPKYLVKIKRKKFDRLYGLYRICIISKKKYRKVTTCNRLDLKTLGFRLIMSKNLPINWFEAKLYIGCSYPCHAHGFWVGMGAMLLFMGGHEWASVLWIPASSSKWESNLSDAGNTLSKKRSGLKLATVNGLLFVRSNQDLV